MEEMFGEVWGKMIHETDFGRKLKENGITLLFIIEDPDVAMYVDESGPVFGDQAKKKTPVVTLKMSGDNVHQFWLNRLNVPKALALRQIKAKGPVGKVLQILPLLKPGKALYPDYCMRYGLSTT
jgi:hypothetical protein